MKKNWIIIGAIVLVLVIAGAIYANSMNKSKDAMMEGDHMMQDEKQMTGSDEKMQGDDAMMEDDKMMGDDKMMEETPAAGQQDSMMKDDKMMEEK